MKKRTLKFAATAVTAGTWALLPLSSAAEVAGRVVSVSSLPMGLLSGLGVVSLLCIGAAAAYKAK